MKKRIVVTSLVLVLALGIVGCSGLNNPVYSDPKVPVPCGDTVLEVSVDKVEEYKKACSTEAEQIVQQSVNCQPAAVVAEVVPAVVVKQPSVVVNAEVKCSYDYNIMPEGRDSSGTPLADYGIFNIGTVNGPAIVQLDSLQIVAVYPGNSYSVTDATDPVWVYSGDSDCLEAQFQYFPGKSIVPIQ